MNCKKCLLAFQEQNGQENDGRIGVPVPRILTECGHSACHLCLVQSITERHLDMKCPDCAKDVFSQAMLSKIHEQIDLSKDDANEGMIGIEQLISTLFPVNQSLLQMKENLENLQQQFEQKEPMGQGLLRSDPSIDFDHFRRDEAIQSENAISHIHGESLHSLHPVKGPSQLSQMSSSINYNVGRRRGPSLTNSLYDRQIIHNENWDQDISVDPDYLQFDNTVNTQTDIMKKKQLNAENEIHRNRQRIMSCITQKSISAESNNSSEIDSVDSNGNIINSSRQRQRQSKTMKAKCKVHQHKKVEAFCETCLHLLCIECILQQNHKSHEMTSLEQAYKNQRVKFQNGVAKIDQFQGKLENQIFEIKSHIKELEENAYDQRNKISGIFNDIRQKIIQREQTLMKRISDMLESEEILYKQKIQNLNDQIRCIEDVFRESTKMTTESPIVILQKSKLRQELSDEATNKIQTYKCTNSLPDIDRESEIAFIVKQILPKKLRQQLMSGALSYQVRKNETQEVIRQRELMKNQRELDILRQDKYLRNGQLAMTAQGSLPASTLDFNLMKNQTGLVSQSSQSLETDRFNMKAYPISKLNDFQPLKITEFIKESSISLKAPFEKHRSTYDHSNMDKYRSPRLNFAMTDEGKIANTNDERKKKRGSPDPSIKKYALNVNNGGARTFCNKTQLKVNNFWSSTLMTDTKVDKAMKRRSNTIERGRNNYQDKASKSVKRQSFKNRTISNNYKLGVVKHKNNHLISINSNTSEGIGLNLQAPLTQRVRTKDNIDSAINLSHNNGNNHKLKGRVGGVIQLNSKNLSPSGMSHIVKKQPKLNKNSKANRTPLEFFRDTAFQVNKTNKIPVNDKQSLRNKQKLNDFIHRKKTIVVMDTATQHKVQLGMKTSGNQMKQTNDKIVAAAKKLINQSTAILIPAFSTDDQDGIPQKIHSEGEGNLKQAFRNQQNRSPQNNTINNDKSNISSFLYKKVNKSKDDNSQKFSQHNLNKVKSKSREKRKPWGENNRKADSSIQDTYYKKEGELNIQENKSQHSPEKSYINNSKTLQAQKLTGTMPFKTRSTTGFNNLRKMPSKKKNQLIDSSSSPYQEKDLGEHYLPYKNKVDTESSNNNRLSGNGSIYNRLLKNHSSRNNMSHIYQSDQEINKNKQVSVGSNSRPKNAWKKGQSNSGVDLQGETSKIDSPQNLRGSRKVIPPHQVMGIIQNNLPTRKVESMIVQKKLTDGTEKITDRLDDPISEQSAAENLISDIQSPKTQDSNLQKQHHLNVLKENSFRKYKQGLLNPSDTDYIKIDYKQGRHIIANSTNMMDGVTYGEAADLETIMIEANDQEEGAGIVQNVQPSLLIQNRASNDPYLNDEILHKSPTINMGGKHIEEQQDTVRQATLQRFDLSKGKNLNKHFIQIQPYNKVGKILQQQPADQMHTIPTDIHHRKKQQNYQQINSGQDSYRNMMGEQSATSHKKMMSEKLGVIILNKNNEVIDEDNENTNSVDERHVFNAFKSPESFDSSEHSFDIEIDENEEGGRNLKNQKSIEIHESRYSVSNNRNKNLMVYNHDQQKFMSKFGNNIIQKTVQIPSAFNQVGFGPGIQIQKEQNNYQSGANQSQKLNSQSFKIPISHLQSKEEILYDLPSDRFDKKSELKTLLNFSPTERASKYNKLNRQYPVEEQKTQTPNRSGKPFLNMAKSFLSGTNITPIQDFNMETVSHELIDHKYASSNYLSNNDAAKAALTLVTEHGAQNRTIEQPSFLNAFNSNTFADHRMSHVLSQSQISSKIDQSELYRFKEEFIFIFGGNGQKNSRQYQLNSVEVFDVQKEICRLFTHKTDSSPSRQVGYSISAHEVCKPISGFQAVQFQFKKKFNKQYDEKIFLLGGQDQYGNILNAANEFNVNDMKVYDADWKLPLEINQFGLANSMYVNQMDQQNNLSTSAFIAGGYTRIKSTGKLQISKHVYRLYAQQLPKGDESLSQNENTISNVLGNDINANLIYRYDRLADMICPRFNMSLIHVSHPNNQSYELYAIGGLPKDSDKRHISLIEKYDSTLNQWQLLSYKTKDINLDIQLDRLQGQQALYMADGSILIIGGCVINPTQNELSFNSEKICMNIMLKYDIKNNTLTMMPAMNQPRAYFQAVLSSNLRFLYVIGGISNPKKKDQPFQYLKSIEKYDIFQQKWQLLAPLSEKRAMHAGYQILI